MVAAGAELDPSEERLAEVPAGDAAFDSLLPLTESSLSSRGVEDETSRAREAPAAKEP